MSRTSWRPDWFRVVCALMAGLVAGFMMPVSGTVSSAYAGVATQAKIYVFPYQPVFKGIPKEVTTQAGDLLKNEIKQSSEVQLQKGPIFIPEAVASSIKPLSDKDLKKASQLYARGVKQYEALQLQKAHKSFSSALKKYESSLVLLKDFDPVVNTLLMLSVCDYRLDKENEGAKMLVKVIRLRPSLVLDPAKYPPMFRNTMNSIRKRLLRKTRGELEVVANTDGASVFFDGKKVGTSPILLKDLVPGEHYLRVEKEGLQTFASKVMIMPTKKVRIAAVLGGVKKATGPLGAMAEGIRSNTISAAVLKTIRKQGKEIGADFMVIGGIAKVGQNYKLGSYLVNIGKGTVCPMQKIEFDPDLLGASVEVFNMASDMVKKIEGCPDPIKAPFRVVQTAVKKKARMKAVAVGPAVPPPETVKKTKATKAAAPRIPAANPVNATPVAAADFGRGPARPGATVKIPAPVRTTPAVTKITAPVATAAIQPKADSLVSPRVPVARRGMPVIKDEAGDTGPSWYSSWWFWTIVGVVAVGGAAGGMYAAGVFDGGTNGASVDVVW